MELKRCTQCHEFKRLEDFPRSSRLKSGREPMCRACRSIRSKQHYAKNKNRYAERALKWRKDNLERSKALRKEHHARTYQKISAEEWAIRKAATRERTKESIRRYNSRRWHTDPDYRERRRLDKARHDARRRAEREAQALAKDIEKIKTQGVRRKKSHHLICPVLKLFPAMYAAAKRELKKAIDARRDPELKRQSVKNWKRKNPAAVSRQRYRRRLNFQNVICDLTEFQWEAIKAAYQYRCGYCGKRRKLTQDHIVPVSKGGKHTASNIIPACTTCNCSKNARLPLVTYQPHLIA